MTRAVRAEPGQGRSSARGAQVVLDLEVEDGRAHLVLVNCGDGVATDVRVTFSRPLRGLGGSIELSALALFRQLGVLRPGCLLRVFWDPAASLLAGREAEPFEATVTWREPGGASRARRRATYRHDPSIYRTWPQAVRSAATPSPD